MGAAEIGRGFSDFSETVSDFSENRRWSRPTRNSRHKMYAGRAQRSSHAARCALVASNAQLTSRDVRRSRPTLNSRHEMYVGRAQCTTHATKCTLIASNAQLTSRDGRGSRPTYNSRHEMNAGRVLRTTHARVTGRLKPALHLEIPPRITRISRIESAQTVTTLKFSARIHPSLLTRSTF